MKIKAQLCKYEFLAVGLIVLDSAGLPVLTIKLKHVKCYLCDAVNQSTVCKLSLLRVKLKFITLNS